MAGVAGTYCSPASRLIDFNVPVGTSSDRCRPTGNCFPVIGLYHMLWLAPSRRISHPAFRSSFSSSLYLTASPPFGFSIIARICTYVNTNIRIRTYSFRRIVKIANQGRTLSPTVFYPPQIGTSTRRGEFRDGGLTFFISELETTPALSLRAFCILHGALVWLAAFAWCEISLCRASCA